MKTLRYMMDGRVLVMLDPDDIEIAVLHLSEGMTNGTRQRLREKGYSARSSMDARRRKRGRAMKRILCIDDSPMRFRVFYLKASKLGIQLLITDHPDTVRWVLDYPVLDAPLIGICLDHDMPGRDARKMAVELLGPWNIPVAIVSNNYDGARILGHILDEFAVPNRAFPASTGGPEWVDSILEWFNA